MEKTRPIDHDELPQTEPTPLNRPEPEYEEYEPEQEPEHELEQKTEAPPSAPPNPRTIANKTPADTSQPVPEPSPPPVAPREPASAPTAPDTDRRAPEASSAAGQRRRMPSIQTYESDARETVEKQGASLSSIRQARLRKARLNKDNASAEQPSTRSFGQLFVFYTSLVLVTAGLVSLLVVGYLVFLAPDETPMITPSDTLILSQSTVPIDIRGKDRAAVIDALEDAIDAHSGGSRNDVAVFVFTRNAGGGEQIPAASFLEIIESRVPAVLARNLDDAFVVGAFTADSSPFLILTTSSYEQVYPAMLAWEPAMTSDLAGIITARPIPPSIQSTDVIVDNKDARALRSADGSEVLVYLFIDTRTIVIAPDTETLRRAITVYRTARRL